MTEKEFWQSNPRKMRAYIEAYKMRVKRDDELAHLQGQYFYVALCTALDHAFSDNSKLKYPERPFLALRDMSEQEKQREVDQFFASTKSLRANWKAKKKRQQTDNEES